MAKIFVDGQWIPEGRGNTYSLHHEDSATPNYEAKQRRIFSGPEDPIDDGQTVMDGDIWFDPEEGVIAQRAAGDVTFDDSTMDVVTGVSNVQAALAKVDDRFVPPVAKGWRNAALSSTSGSLDQIVLDTQAYDTHGIFDPANGRFTVPVGYAGIWHFTAQISWTTNTSGARTLGFTRNNVDNFNLMKTSASQSGSTLLNGSIDIAANEGDYFTLTGVQNATTLAYGVGSEFSTYMTALYVRPLP